MTQKDYAIVGGGIGGLTLAIALQQKGFKVTVYENAQQLKPLGAGLVLAANAVKALIQIGISDQVLQAGKVLKSLRVKQTDGGILTETNSEKMGQKFGLINNFTIHRADLHRVLLSLLKPGIVQLNKGCTGFEENLKGITLNFSDGTTATADYVIACDGIHSAIRKQLLPQSLPRYAGYTCWRAVIDHVPANVDMDETSETWGPGSRFGIVPLNDNRLYWFACLNASEKDPTMQAATTTELLNYFTHFHSPIKEILEATPNESLIWNDIVDIKPLKKFAFGKIVLMGDAAHATTPNMGQGACMAIEDAAVLANCIEQHSTGEEAFVTFERKRIERTTWIVNTSRRIGRVAQIENPFLIQLRNFGMKLTPESVTEKQIRFLSEVSFD